MASNSRYLNCGLINIQSVCNKTNEIRDLIIEKNLDILCVTETWLHELSTSIINEMTPSTHTFLHVPRETQGGGVGIFLHKSFTNVRTVKPLVATSFEYLMVNFKHSNAGNGGNFSFIVLYRPPNLSVPEFFEQFEELLEKIDTVAFNVIVVGDFNFHIDNTIDRNTIRFNELIESYSLINKVSESTSNTGHILDLVICDSASNFLGEIIVEEKCRFTSIHKLILFKISGSKEVVVKNISFRNKSNFVPNEFVSEASTKIDEMLITLCTHTNVQNKSECVECLAWVYNSICRGEYDTMCPEISKTIRVKDKSPWFNGEVLAMK